jgi:hypothetical protein
MPIDPVCRQEHTARPRLHPQARARLLRQEGLRMRRVKTALALVTIALVAVTFAPSRLAAPPPSLPGSEATAADVSTSTLDPIEEARWFRERQGLRHDPAYVAAAASDPAYSDDEYGVPLTEVETGELDRRAAIGMGLGPLIDALEKNPDFAGIHLDPRQGGSVEIAVAGGIEGVARDVAALLPPGATVHYRTVQFTLAELQATRDAILRDVETLLEQGINVTSIDADEKRNAVLVSLDPYRESDAAELRTRYGRSVVVDGGTPAQFDSDK